MKGFPLKFSLENRKRVINPILIHSSAASGVEYCFGSIFNSYGEFPKTPSLLGEFELNHFVTNIITVGQKLPRFCDYKLGVK